MVLLIIKWISGILLAILAGLVLLIRVITFHPAETQQEKVISPPDTPMLHSGQTLKVLSWNVQFMAGKNYLFYYDTKNFDGPDERPSSEDITATVEEVARIIRDEDPDMVLLQELDDGAKRTDHEDQLERLLSLLPPAYKCHSSAFYWKAKFVPHPRIMGAAGMKLSTISKYAISRSVRHQLPQMPANPVSRQFNLKRAVLETYLPLSDGSELVVLNTHLDAFAQGTNTMEQQVGFVDSLLAHLDRDGVPWLIGGDFNLLPPGNSYTRLPEENKHSYRPETEIVPLFTKYAVMPGSEETNGPEREKWFTFFWNGSKTGKPDRTIDYIFHSKKLVPVDRRVRQHDTLRISDHLPLVFEFDLP